MDILIMYSDLHGKEAVDIVIRSLVKSKTRNIITIYKDDGKSDDTWIPSNALMECIKNQKVILVIPEKDGTIPRNIRRRITIGMYFNKQIFIVEEKEIDGKKVWVF